jgi:hypothetical protein
MNITNSYSETSTEILPLLDSIVEREHELAKATVEQYLTLLGFHDPERRRLAEQVTHRAAARRDADPLTRGALVELHRVLGGSTEIEALRETEAGALMRSSNWRAVSCMESRFRRQEKSLTGWDRNEYTRLSSVPPLERRGMVPEEIEYLSWRSIGRSLITWLLGKRAPAQLSLGRIAGK